MVITHYITFYVSLFCTWSVYTKTLFYISNIHVGILCLLDYTLHLLHIEPLKTDLCIHHVFALMVVLFTIETHSSYNTEEKLQLMADVVSVEISTIFLSINYFLKGNKNIHKMSHMKSLRK